MTDNRIEKIRAEIERRYNEYMAKDSELAAIRADECLGILSYIDSMQEEPVSEEIEVSYDAKINEAHRLGREEGILLAKTMFKEPVSEDMWEASKQYALRQVLASTDAEMTEQAYLSLKLFSGFEIAVAHKDGANWQKQKDKSKVLTEEQCRKIRDDAFELGKDAMKQQILDSNTTLQRTFELGKQEMKQQMMKEAVEARFTLLDGFCIDRKLYKNYKVGGKYKLIIIKEDLL